MDNLIAMAGLTWETRTKWPVLYVSVSSLSDNLSYVETGSDDIVRFSADSPG